MSTLDVAILNEKLAEMARFTEGWSGCSFPGLKHGRAIFVMCVTRNAILNCLLSLRVVW